MNNGNIQMTIMIFLGIVLLYMLYKRLLQNFTTSLVGKEYPHLLDRLIDGKQLTIRYHFPEASSGRIVMKNLDDHTEKLIVESEFPEGEGEYVLSLNEFEAGKYEYSLVTEDQRSSQFITID